MPKGARKVINVEEVVRKILIDHLDVGDHDLVRSASIMETLGAESLDSVQIVMACETAFGLEIPGEDTFALSTVGELIGYLERRLEALRAPKAWTAVSGETLTEFWIVLPEPAGGARKPVVRMKPQNRCRHREKVVDEHKRIVQCRDCGARLDLDPIWCVRQTIQYREPIDRTIEVMPQVELA